MCICSCSPVYSNIIVCLLYLSLSAFARYPDGDIEHYYCAKENMAKEQGVVGDHPPATKDVSEQSRYPGGGREPNLDTNPF